MSGRRPRRRQPDPRPTIDTSRADRESQLRPGGGHHRGQQVRLRYKKQGKSQHSQTELDTKKVLLPQSLRIREIPQEKYEGDLESFGTIEDWQAQLEFLEKARMRPYLTVTVMILWAALTIACIIEFLITGTFLLIVMPELLGIPLGAILWFYYGWFPHT